MIVREAVAEHTSGNGATAGAFLYFAPDDHADAEIYSCEHVAVIGQFHGAPRCQRCGPMSTDGSVPQPAPLSRKAQIRANRSAWLQRYGRDRTPTMAEALDEDGTEQ